MTANSFYRIPTIAALALACSMLRAEVPAQQNAREEGEYRILAAGKEIGAEKYVIVVSGESASSSSIVNFRNPANNRQKVHFETKLEMDAHFVPRSYELKSDVDGRKGVITGSFIPNQAMFEYQSGGPPRKSGLLVGDRFTLLDTNIFHHFVFLARLYDFNSKEKTQRFEVAIPQEGDSGFLKITEIRKEGIIVRGKKVDAHKLRADSGVLVMQLWVDDRHSLHKIVVEGKGIEVVRKP